VNNLIVLLAVLLLRGAVEGFRHRRNLERIPIRIHVNGTHGKSSGATTIGSP
jgi:hypothetical protein